MEPRITWWSTLVSVNATVLAIAATFRAKFGVAHIWTGIALGLLSVSLVLGITMLYAWTHKPKTEKLAGLTVGSLTVFLFACGFAILVVISFIAVL